MRLLVGDGWTPAPTMRRIAEYRAVAWLHGEVERAQKLRGQEFAAAAEELARHPSIELYTDALRRATG